MLRQIEVQMANGKTAPQACKEAGIHTPTYDRLRKECGGLKLEQAKWLKEAERVGRASLAGCGPGKLLSPERRRCAAERSPGLVKGRLHN
ncbi:MAG: hypothetical protein OXB98_01990 [Bryobacterales bacterium]|nr:hypothetical protein [Bryobacterales bacterium]